MIKGNAPEKRIFFSMGWTKRVLPVSLWLALAFPFVAASFPVAAAEYPVDGSEAAAPPSGVPWMVEDHQSATNWYRAQDSDQRLPPPEPEVHRPRQQSQVQGNWEVEQWSGRRVKVKHLNTSDYDDNGFAANQSSYQNHRSGGNYPGNNQKSNQNFYQPRTNQALNNQDALAADPAFRKPDRFVDNPQVDTDGVRHFSNGKHFDLKNVSLEKAVDLVNASNLGPRPNQGNRLNQANQFNGAVSNSSFTPITAMGGNFANRPGQFANYTAADNFGNRPGQFANYTPADNFGNRPGQFANYTPADDLTPAQRRRRNQARRLARMMMNNW